VTDADGASRWLLPALGYTMLAVLPLALLVWWRGPRVLLNPVAFVGLAGGGVLLLIAFVSAALHDYQKWNVLWLVASIAGIAAGAAAAWASGPGDKLDTHVAALTVASGFWLLWWGNIAFDMWRYALRR
jgi:uncharacterized membrane protein